MNEEMMGLAGQGTQEQGMQEQGMQEQALPQRDEMEQMVVQVAQLIMQGATAQELLQMGVPQNVIDMAMQLVQSQQGSVAGPTQNAGLAGSQL